MRVKLFFRWYDFWIGWYWDRKAHALYVCYLPMCGLCFEDLDRISNLVCSIVGHRYGNWVENTNRHAIKDRYRWCERCEAFQIEQ